MDRESLERFLAAGLSLEAIGRRVGCDASTVGYWVKKHGLRAVHSDKHGRGVSVSEEELAALVQRGLSYSAMAAQLGVSVHTIRRRMARWGLQTTAANNRRLNREAKRAGQAIVRRDCVHHGESDFFLEGRGCYRCLRCRRDAVARRRRKVKAILVEELGGRCRVCGYNRYVGALHFHHLDPQAKRFQLSFAGLTRSLDEMRAEARTCALLCSNCHAEVEAGMLSVPSSVEAGTSACSTLQEKGAE